MEIVLATRNKKKIEEIRRMFTGSGIIFLDLNEFPECPEVEENGTSFSENADLKARAVAGHTQRHALADDSGLVVDALSGAPGVRSARFAGPDATDEQNLQHLVASLNKHAGANRNARFECVLSLSDPQGRSEHFSGTVHGVIIDTPRGSNGFGYDPVFVPRGEHMTFAEMPSWKKDQISHRGRALAAFAQTLTRRQSPS
ncbi:MAG: RdgB/HAM1 family non-canonical purine NTP pyrophosphatase [Magnetococcales bacterium]|nr:RdgB/HAM1 family non-canonical purine NTP pyrophosphatase [Magnetococcales bacterium]